MKVFFGMFFCMYDSGATLMVNKALKKAFPIEELILRGHSRLLFDSHETSSIIWIGKSAPAIHC
jgi:hypothetical protein